MIQPARLVAEELRGTAAEADADDRKDGSQRKQDGVPIEHGAHPAGRVAQVLTGPQGDQRADDEALEAEDEKAAKDKARRKKERQAETERSNAKDAAKLKAQQSKPATPALSSNTTPRARW